MKIRKNDKAYLQDLKIDIQTSRDDHYQELSLLFDKPQFLNLLPYWRHNFKITQLLPVKDFINMFHEHLLDQFGDKATLTVDLSKYTSIKEIKREFPEFYDQLTGNGATNWFPEMLDAECHLICYEFKRPPYFVESIEQAIFCGAVDDTCFKPTEAKSINFELMGSWPTLERIAIFLSPTSTYEDVKEEFRKAKELMKTDKRLSYYQPKADIAPNIRKYRKWYWERIHGKKYKEIADECPNTVIVTENDVLRAVKTYTNLLSH